MKKYNTTLGELFNTRQLIINNGIMELAFSRKGGLSVARNLKKIDDELIEYSKARDELIRKYSDDGVTMERSNPNWEAFAKEFEELGSVEASIDINTITEFDLPDAITPATCLAIEFMIEEEEEVK